MKLGFRILPLLTVAALTNMLLASISIKPDVMVSQTVNKISKVPRKQPPLAPRGTRAPGNRSAAASRDDGCAIPQQELTALVPEFKQPNDEISVWGQTTAAYPKIWLFMPYTSKNTQLTLSLKDEQGKHTFRVDPPATAGIISIQVPSSLQPLKIDQNYRWKLTAKIYCGQKSEEKNVIGWVSRVNLASTTDSNWYDDVTNLGEQLVGDPNNIQLRQEWKELLQLVKLEEIANQPFVGEVRTSKK